MKHMLLHLRVLEVLCVVFVLQLCCRRVSIVLLLAERWRHEGGLLLQDRKRHLHVNISSATLCRDATILVR